MNYDRYSLYHLPSKPLRPMCTQAEPSEILTAFELGQMSLAIEETKAEALPAQLDAEMLKKILQDFDEDRAWMASHR